MREWPNIHVIPYVRGRLLFSRLVYKAVNMGKYDTIVTDLPHFMQAAEWIDRPMRQYPYLLTYHFEYNGSMYYHTFTPNDAAVAGLILARKNNVPYHCIDDAVYLYHSPFEFFNPNQKLRDEHFIYQQGMGGFFKQPWKKLSTIWQGTDEPVKSLSLSRAGKLKERLIQLAENGQNILFVCDYRLWWLITKIFQGMDFKGSKTSYPFVFEDINFAVTTENPYFLWAKSELDDYPPIVHDFYKTIMNDNGSGMDSLQKLEQLLNDFLSELAGNKEENISPRRILKFKQFVQNQLLINGRIMPFPVKHMLDSAQSCLGKSASELLARTLLAYPFNGNRDPGFFKSLENGFEFYDSEIELPDILKAAAWREDLLDALDSSTAYEGIKERIDWIDKIHAYVTEDEREHFKTKDNGLRWDTSVDKKLYHRVCTDIKETMQRKQDIYKTKKSSGNLADGIDFKATIASRARKENALYIKEKMRRTRNMQISAYSPIVFIFKKEKTGSRYTCVRDDNVTRRMGNLDMAIDPNIKYPDPKTVYSSLRFVYQTDYVLENHISREKMSAIAFNTVSKYMEFNRYYEITVRPGKYLSWKDPSIDHELTDFQGHEKLVAWTVKYAEFSTIVFAYKGWRPSVPLFDFAKSKNTHIIVHPISTFSADLLNRLSTAYFISGTLKKHKKRERILRRYIK